MPEERITESAEQLFDRIERAARLDPNLPNFNFNALRLEPVLILTRRGDGILMEIARTESFSLIDRVSTSLHGIVTAHFHVSDVDLPAVVTVEATPLVAPSPIKKGRRVEQP